MKKEIWIDETSLKELYKSGSVFAKLRTEIQSIPEVQLVEADLDMASEIDRLHAINAELVEALEKISKIPNQQFGPDWEEIDEARLIAITVLDKVKQ